MEMLATSRRRALTQCWLSVWIGTAAVVAAAEPRGAAQTPSRPSPSLILSDVRRSGRSGGRDGARGRDREGDRAHRGSRRAQDDAIPVLRLRLPDDDGVVDGAVVEGHHLLSMLGLEGGGQGEPTNLLTTSKPPEIGRKRKKDGSSTRRTWLDSTITFFEAPGFDITVGIVAITLCGIDVAREVHTYGLKKAMGQANHTVMFLAFVRFLKAFVTVLKNSKQVLRGYKTYALVQRGKNVFLRAVPASDLGDDGDI